MLKVQERKELIDGLVEEFREEKVSSMMSVPVYHYDFYICGLRLICNQDSPTTVRITEYFGSLNLDPTKILKKDILTPFDGLRKHYAGNFQGLDHLGTDTFCYPIEWKAPEVYGSVLTPQELLTKKDKDLFDNYLIYVKKEINRITSF